MTSQWKRFSALALCAGLGVAAYAEGADSITETMTGLVLQIGLLLFAVRACGALAKRLGIPSVLGELLSGVIIGPYALGGLALPGFPQGFFPLGSGSLAVSPELYGFATVASIVLLFASGLETDLSLFLRYSVVGGVVGLGGVIASFGLGDLVGSLLLKAPFMDPRCLFLGILSTATSVGITARILSDQRKMDSPEGVTILAAAVFDDVLGIILLAVVLGIVAVVEGSSAGAPSAAGIAAIAFRAFGIWLGFTALGLVFSRRIATFLKIFRHPHDFSILALGLALILAGIFEKEGLAMIIGAYIIGLSLSKTDIAPVVQEKLRVLYEFFVPLFFAVMGMLVNVRELASPDVLAFGGIYVLAAVVAKVLGCGLPSLALGFNGRGALRIGVGMVPRGEVALIIAGIGLAGGILDQRIFGVTILMTLATTLIAPPVLSAALRLPGTGTKKPVKGAATISAEWEFPSREIGELVADSLLNDLKTEGFYVQTMNLDEGISQARKGDVALAIVEGDRKLALETSPEDMSFVKTLVYEALVRLDDSVEKLKAAYDPQALRKEAAEQGGRADRSLFKIISPDCVITSLRGTAKEDVITELVDLLAAAGKLADRDLVLKDVLAREATMSTGMQHGLALPHAKTDGVESMQVALGLKPEGIDFSSIDGEPSRIFFLVASPTKAAVPHVQFLATVGAALSEDADRARLLAARTPEEALAVLAGKA